MIIRKPNQRDAEGRRPDAEGCLHRDPKLHRPELRTPPKRPSPDELLDSGQRPQPDHRGGLRSPGAEASLHLGPLPYPLSRCRRPASRRPPLTDPKDRRASVSGGLLTHHAAVPLLDVLEGKATTEGRKCGDRASGGSGATSSPNPRSSAATTRPKPALGQPALQNSEIDPASVRPGLHLPRSRRAPRRRSGSNPATLDLCPQSLRGVHEPAQLTLRS